MRILIMRGKVLRKDQNYYANKATMRKQDDWTNYTVKEKKKKKLMICVASEAYSG